jgi:predicted branched-subunit amino acid permease
MQPAMPATRSAFLRGCRHALPFLIVVVPFSMLFGVLATDAGLSQFEVVAFSVTVFAGAAQFAALQLMHDQAPLLVILATALAVNLRMVMYSIALSPHLGAAPFGIRAAIAYFLVDQSYVASAAEFDRNPNLTMAEKVAYFFGSIALIAPLWYFFTWLGAHLGRAIPPEYALDFAVPITFLAIIAPMIRTLPHVAATAVSVLGALALFKLPFGTGLLVAAGLAMATGATLEYLMERKGARIAD